MKDIIKVLVFAMSLLLFSCGDNDGDCGECSLSKYNVEVEEGAIIIISVIGSKIYDVEIDETIAKATKLGSEISVLGIKEGITTLLVHVAGKELKCKVVVIAKNDEVPENPDEESEVLADASLRIVGRDFGLHYNDGGVLFAKNNKGGLITYSAVELDNGNRSFSFSLKQEITNQTRVEVVAVRSTDVVITQQSVVGDILKQESGIVWLKLDITTDASIICVFEK